MRSILSGVLFAVASFVVMPTSNAAVPTGDDEGRGCCSHHHGVCGCSGGRSQCCDGTTSPSCTCRADP